MSSKNEMIQKLKVNLAQYSELSDEEQEFLEGKKLLVLRDDGEWKVVPRCCCYDALRYRLPEDYHEESEPEYVVCEIEELKSNRRCGEVEYLGRLYGGFPIDMLPRKVGFGGVQFKGQAQSHIWAMDVCMAIDSCGELYTYTTDREDEKKPATPVRARFLVK